MRETSTRTGTLLLDGNTIMEITQSSDNHPLTLEEAEFFEEIKDIKNLNFVDGKPFDPEFGPVNGPSALSMPVLANLYPESFTLDVGITDLFIDPEAAAEYSPELGRIFSMAQTRMVLGFYFVNKFTMRFNF